MRLYAKYNTGSPEETMKIAGDIASILRCGDTIALFGEMGTGKTTFVKGLARGLGVEDYYSVNSPSYVIMKEYQGRLPLFHFDVYRLEGDSFGSTVDHERYFYSEGISVVEWAGKINDLLPADRIDIFMSYGPDENSRILELRVLGELNNRDMGLMK